MTTFLAEVFASDFDGWLVVEQDLYPQPGIDSLPQVRADHSHNRAALRAWV
jgi:inosose dehydratase